MDTVKVPRLTDAEILALARAVLNLETEITDHTLPGLRNHGMEQTAIDLREYASKTIDALSPLIEGGDEALWKELGIYVEPEVA